MQTEWRGINAPQRQVDLVVQNTGFSLLTQGGNMKQGDYMVCPTCSGKGLVYDHEAGLMTFGLAYLYGKVRCPQCKGKGYIKII